MLCYDKWQTTRYLQNMILGGGYVVCLNFSTLLARRSNIGSNLNYIFNLAFLGQIGLALTWTFEFMYISCNPDEHQIFMFDIVDKNKLNVW